MKKITLWLFALFTCWQISAQTGTIVVGVNDGTPNGDQEYPSPLQDYYKTQRSQFLYTASELTGAGLVAGNITSIGWIATNLNTSTLQENYQISMKSTTSTVLTTTYESGATVVYGPTDYTPSATGNVMFTLTTPFVWDGTSNIIVEVCAGLASGAFTTNVSCANSTTTDIKTTYFRSDGELSPCTIATGTTSNQRPLMVVVGNVASCLAPLNVVTGAITSSGVAVSWDAATPTPGVGYEYVVSTSSATPTAAGTATTATFASVSGLLPQTTYYVFLRSVCAAGTNSGWNGPAVFTTACANVTNFVQNFDAVTTPNFPTCWAKVGADGYANTQNYDANSAPNTLYIVSYGATDRAVVSMQQVSNLGAGTNRIKFSMRANYTVGDVIEFGYLTDPLDDSTFTAITSFTASTLTYASYQFSPPAGTYSDFPAFRHAGNLGNSILIDNVVWETNPSCLDASGLVVGGITSTGANVSWDTLAGVTGYEYAVTTSATPPVSGTATTSTFAVITSLTPQTGYYLHVRAVCAASTFGVWTTVAFTTNCANVTSFVQNFDAVTTPNFPTCWAKVGTGGYAYTQGYDSSSTPNTLYMVSYSTTDLAVVSTQQVSNLGAGTNRIKFSMRGYTAGGIVEFGYLTDPTSAASFVALTSFTASSTTYATYQFSPPAGTYSDFPAFRHTGVSTNSVLIDNVVWETSPSCPDQTGVVFGSVTSSGVGISWDAITGAAGYEYAVTTSATPPASGTAITATFNSVSGLNPQTLYYIHVRPMCSATSFGNWATVSFTTACVPVTTLPWTEGFEGVTTPALPTCWSEENGDYTTSSETFYNNAHAGTKYLRNAWSATNEFVWTPGFTLTAGTSYDFSSFVQGDNGTSWVVDYFVNTSQLSTGATQLGASYNVPGSGAPYAPQSYALVTRSFVPATTGTYYFAVRVNEPTGGPWYVAFDDFEVKLSPACPTPSAAAAPVTSATATLTWAAVPSATVGYEYVLNTVATDPTGAGTATTALTYSATALTQLTQYYFHIRSVCSAGVFSTWSTTSFTTLATPPVNDNCANAIVLTPGGTFATSPLIASNSGATNSNPPAPGCGGFSGGDVWYSVVVPASGSISLETGTGTVITDTGMAVYSGTCAALTLVECDDDDSLDGAFSLITLTNRTPGEVLYVSAWEYNNDSVGTFQISAYDASLGNSSFDNATFVAYPNPVVDVLNLNYKTTIDNVRVINLLGQEVMNLKSNSNDVKVDMSSLAAGAYIVNVSVDNAIKTIKIIKK